MVVGSPLVGVVVIATAPERNSSMEALTRFVAERSTQQLCHAKRYEFEGVRPCETDEALGSSETRVGRE